MRGIAILLILALIGNANAATVGSQSFFGFCNEASIEQNDLGAMVECGGNFLSPMVPNPLKIVEPISGDKFWNNITVIKDKLFSLDLLGVIGDIIKLIFDVIFGLIINAVSFLFVFMVRFIFVYVFYISLGLQTIILFFDKNSSGLGSRDKITASILFMAAITVFILAYGGGWAQWS